MSDPQAQTTPVSLGASSDPAKVNLTMALVNQIGALMINKVTNLSWANFTKLPWNANVLFYICTRYPFISLSSLEVTDYDWHLEKKISQSIVISPMKKLNQKQMFSMLLVRWQESAPNNKKIFLFVCFACVGLTRFASQVARKPL